LILHSSEDTAANEERKKAIKEVSGSNPLAPTNGGAVLRGFRDNFGTFEKWELSGFRGVSDTNEAI
jgi:hypothetical protein